MGTPTQTGIVNAALAELGSTKRIQSIDEEFGIAPDAKAVWDSCMRTLLSEHPWNWAIGRATLNATTAPAFGYERAYTLPADCLRWLPSSSDDDDWFDGREEGGLLLTDAETANVRYISAELGGRVAVWPAYFVRAMELAIAARLAEPVTQDESIKDRMEEKAEIALRKAKRRDGIASNGPNRSQVTVRSDWLAARDRPYHRYRR